jgi:predicted nucleotidyltransferase
MSGHQERTEYVNLLEQTLQHIVATLSRREDIERVSIFGSYARGRRDLFTDLDLLIVMRTERDFVDRLRLMYELLASPVDMDLLCYTPEEFQALKESPFLRRILQEEVVLYEKKRL